MEDLLQIHAAQLEQYGGSPGIRDLGALEAALAMPQAGMGGEFFHKSLEEMAAAYLCPIVQNHALTDGNKRVALAAALYFLDLNGRSCAAGQADLTELVMQVAAGKKDKAGVASFFKRFR